MPSFFGVAMVVEVLAWGGLGYPPCGHPCFVDITGGYKNCFKAQEELLTMVFYFLGGNGCSKKSGKIR